MNEMDKCKGVYVRLHKNFYYSNGSLNFNYKLTLLKKRSCPGCDKCLKKTLELDMTEMDCFSLKTNLENLKCGGIYKFIFMPDGVDPETGYFDGWYWKLEEVGDGKK